MTRPHPLRAILLARVSTTHAVQETSPDRQLARLGAIAEARGWHVVDRIVEKASGSQILDRPPVARALDRIVHNEADVLMVDHLTRLGRNVRELLEVLDLLKNVGGSFYDASNSIDTTGPLGRLIFTVYASVGEFEIADRKLKINEGLARARERGVRLGPPKKLPVAAERRALELRRAVDGAGVPLYSWNVIVKMLDDEGLGKHTRGAISTAVLKLLKAEELAEGAA